MIVLSNLDLERRFLEIKPNYNLTTNYICEGRELISIERDNITGKITLEIAEHYLTKHYALKTKYITRHPRLTKEQFDYIVEGE